MFDFSAHRKVRVSASMENGPKATGLRILNGRHPGGHANDFTFSSASGLSVIDYVLCNADMFECVQEFIISSFNEYYAHAPLHLVLDIRCYNNAVNRDHA